MSTVTSSRLRGIGAAAVLAVAALSLPAASAQASDGLSWYTPYIVAPTVGQVATALISWDDSLGCDPATATVESEPAGIEIAPVDWAQVVPDAETGTVMIPYTASDFGSYQLRFVFDQCQTTWGNIRFLAQQSSLSLATTEAPVGEAIAAKFILGGDLATDVVCQPTYGIVSEPAGVKAVYQYSADGMDYYDLTADQPGTYTVSYLGMCGGSVTGGTVTFTGSGGSTHLDWTVSPTTATVGQNIAIGIPWNADLAAACSTGDRPASLESEPKGVVITARAEYLPPLGADNWVPPYVNYLASANTPGTYQIRYVAGDCSTDWQTVTFTDVTPPNWWQQLIEQILDLLKQILAIIQSFLNNLPGVTPTAE